MVKFCLPFISSLFLISNGYYCYTLCNVVISELSFKICLFLGEALKTNTMVVAMHRSECGQTETVYNRSSTPEDTLHSLALTNIYYNGDRTFDCLQNKNAKGGIESFLTE